MTCAARRASPPVAYSPRLLPPTTTSPPETGSWVPVAPYNPSSTHLRHRLRDAQSRNASKAPSISDPRLLAGRARPKRSTPLPHPPAALTNDDATASKETSMKIPLVRWKRSRGTDSRRPSVADTSRTTYHWVCHNPTFTPSTPRPPHNHLRHPPISRNRTPTRVMIARRRSTPTRRCRLSKRQTSPSRRTTVGPPTMTSDWSRSSWKNSNYPSATGTNAPDE